MATQRTEQRDWVEAIAMALFVGFPLGVLGNVFVATTVFFGFGLFESLQDGMEWAVLGLWGGAATGLVTGGPVFAIVAAFRPIKHAWVWVFVPCLIASIIGGVLEWLLPRMTTEGFLVFYLPVLTLVCGSIIYLVRTKHLAPVWIKRSTYASRHDPFVCAHCSYDLRGLESDAPCPECGTERG